MNKGFLTIAQNGQYDYVKMAYVLAMSLKLSQSKYNKLSVIVNEKEKIPSKYWKLFDKVITIEKPKDKWKIQNKWQYFNLSPYNETIVLDTDMLFFNDITTWWKCLESSDIEFTTSVRNYRRKIITSDYYRKTFTKNNLPNLYTALFYFRKTTENDDYFKLVKEIKDAPRFLSGDVAYSLAAKIMFNRNWDSFLTFIHMRGRLQDDDIVSGWNKELSTFFTTYHEKIELKVSNFNQIYPFHYIKKDFLSEEVIELYEDKIRLL